jgi:hypothetical protein
MTPASQRASATRWALLTLLIAMLLGHVCVLPLHAHATTAATHQHGDEPDETDQAAHIGSCEALLSSPIVQPLAVVTGTIEWAASPLEATAGVVYDRVAAPCSCCTPHF